jgi:hypothetical protein
MTRSISPANPNPTKGTHAMTLRAYSAPINELIGMHKYRRPARSKTEAAFCEKYIATLPSTWQDTAGNWIGAIGENPVTLWSSHTDTVHDKDGMQKLAIDSTTDDLFIGSAETDSTCLGADCTVGVWLMRRMYLARVPGLYIWHAEEECGGCGSAFIADKARDILDGIQSAIAFDRKGVTSVITHQFGGRCASDVFANSLAAMLGPKYTTDSGGTFTDTANYTEIVPECTNVSVGYFGQHTKSEYTNLAHAEMLLDRMLAFDESKLLISRDPSYRAPAYSLKDDPWWDRKSGHKGNQYGTHSLAWADLDDLTDDKSDHERLLAIVRDDPYAVAALLEDYGITADQLMEELGWKGGK